MLRSFWIAGTFAATSFHSQGHGLNRHPYRSWFTTLVFYSCSIETPLLLKLGLPCTNYRASRDLLNGSNGCLFAWDLSTKVISVSTGMNLKFLSSPKRPTETWLSIRRLKMQLEHFERTQLTSPKNGRKEGGLDSRRLKSWNPARNPDPNTDPNSEFWSKRFIEFTVYITKTYNDSFFSPSPMLCHFAGFRLHRPQPPRMQLLWWMRILQVLWSLGRCLWPGKTTKKQFILTRWILESSPETFSLDKVTQFFFWEIPFFLWSHIKSHLDVIWTSRLQDTHNKNKNKLQDFFGWWFQIFVFARIWGRFPFWLIFLKGVEATN